MFWSELIHFFKARHTSGIILNIIPEYKSNFHHCTFLNLLALTCTVLHVLKIWWTGTFCDLSNIQGIHLILELTEFRSDKMQNGRNKNKTINVYWYITSLSILTFVRVHFLIGIFYTSVWRDEFICFIYLTEAWVFFDNGNSPFYAKWNIIPYWNLQRILA